MLKLLKAKNYIVAVQKSIILIGAYIQLFREEFVALSKRVLVSHEFFTKTLTARCLI